MDRDFWQYKDLWEMSFEEWEALCDGCGQCCLHKLEYVDTGQLAFTCVACRLLDIERCRCQQYKDRKAARPECLFLTPENVGNVPWLPATCAYRLIREGKGLPCWHPLVSGDPESVHRAGISVRHRAVSEDCVDSGNLEWYIVDDK